MFAVYHYIWRKNSDQNGARRITRWHSSRKGGRGDLKHSFNSQLELMLKHDHFGDNYEIVQDAFLIRGWDDEGTSYIHQFFLVESDNDL